MTRSIPPSRGKDTAESDAAAVAEVLARLVALACLAIAEALPRGILRTAMLAWMRWIGATLPRIVIEVPAAPEAGLRPAPVVAELDARRDSRRPGRARLRGPRRVRDAENSATTRPVRARRVGGISRRDLDRRPALGVAGFPRRRAGWKFSSLRASG